MKENFSFKWHPKIRAMAQEIADDRGQNSLSEAIAYCIAETHKAIFLDYRRGKVGAPTSEFYNTTPVTDASQSEEPLTTAQMIAELKATPIDHDQVEFALYEKLGEKVIVGKRRMYISDLTPAILERQFKGGTKAEIEKLLRKK
jgi:hypothetical protein